MNWKKEIVISYYCFDTFEKLANNKNPQFSPNPAEIQVILPTCVGHFKKVSQYVIGSKLWVFIISLLFDQ